MKKLLSLMAAIVFSLLPVNSKPSTPNGYPINPVAFTSVKVTPGTFWG